MINKIEKLLASSKPYIGSTMRDFLFLSFVVVLLASTSHILWGRATTTYIWLFGLSVWLLLHIKRGANIYERFDDIDQRDMDFHDFYEKKVFELEEELKTLKENSEHKG